MLMICGASEVRTDYHVHVEVHVKTTVRVIHRNIVVLNSSLEGITCEPTMPCRSLDFLR